MKPTVVIITSIPSPYQVEYFNSISTSTDIHFVAIYVSRLVPERLWKLPNLVHEHYFLEDGNASIASASQLILAVDLVVFSCYTSKHARVLMRLREKSRRPWVYWGERPGSRGFGLLGRLWRRIKLAPLFRGPVPVWGIGSWAVDEWQRELCDMRQYSVLSYYSDLSRFAPSMDKVPDPLERRFIFSGSLIHRKGADLLALAFAEVAATRPNLKLHIIGTGIIEPKMRKVLSHLSEQVQFFGFLQWEDIVPHYQWADVLIAPSRYDGWGLIIPEGLASGLLIIATDHMGAAKDLIVHKQNGLIVPAGDLVSLKRAIIDAAELPYKDLLSAQLEARTSVGNLQLTDGVSKFIALTLSATEPDKLSKN